MSSVASKQKGYAEAFYECTEEIAKVLEKHFPSVIEIEDMTRINDLVDTEIVEGARRKHEKDNEINNT